jgi:hypothetical protein
VVTADQPFRVIHASDEWLSLWRHTPESFTFLGQVVGQDTCQMTAELLRATLQVRWGRNPCGARWSLCAELARSPRGSEGTGPALHADAGSRRAADFSLQEGKTGAFRMLTYTSEGTLILSDVEVRSRLPRLPPSATPSSQPTCSCL